MAKTKDKYGWSIGHHPPPIDPHSQIKHEIVRDYVRQYVQILMADPRREKLVLSLVDGFAGGGEFTDSAGNIVDGSPLILLNTCRETEALLNIDRKKPRLLDAKFYFVELLEKNHQYLDALLKAKGYSGQPKTPIWSAQAAFDGVCDTIIKDIKVRKGGERALFLLDQYEYDEVPLSLIRKIFTEVRNAEVLLTFNVGSLITFMNADEKFRKVMRRINLEAHIDWNGFAALKRSNRWKEIIQRQLSLGIYKESGARFMTLFFVRPLGASAWPYWLIHLSNAFRAHDVMMQLHWDHGNSFGHALEPGIFSLGYDTRNDPDASRQEMLELGTEHQFDDQLSRRAIEQLSTVLPREIYKVDKPIAFGNWMSSLANQTTATEAMVKRALDPAVQCGDLIVTGERGERKTKGSRIEAADLIVPSRQTSFFFSPTGMMPPILDQDE